jgi:hypothetical protein
MSKPALPTEVALIGDLGTSAAPLTTLEPSRLIESSIPTENHRNRKRQIRTSITAAVTIRSVQYLEHVIPPGQVEVPRCALRDEPNDTRLTPFHCHQQLHMDFGFMALFQYA